MGYQSPQNRKQANITTNKQLCTWCGKTIHGAYAKAGNKPHHIECAAAQKLWWDRENMKDEQEKRSMLILRMITFVGFIIGGLMTLVGAHVAIEHAGRLDNNHMMAGGIVMFIGLMVLCVGITTWMIIHQRHREKAGKDIYDEWTYFY